MFIDASSVITHNLVFILALYYRQVILIDLFTPRQQYYMSE